MRFSKDQKQALRRWGFSDIPSLTISYIPVLWPPGASASVARKPVTMGLRVQLSFIQQNQILITFCAAWLPADKVVNSGLTFLTLVSIMRHRTIRKEIAGGGLIPKENGLQTASLARGQ